MEINAKLGLGTVQFGIPYGISNTHGQTSPAEVRKILNLASNNGINLIDTASAYGNAEEVLGKNKLQGFTIVSKFMSHTKGETISQQLYKSLAKLRQNSLYGYLAHRPLNVLEKPWQWEELKELKSKGLIKKIGFSFNDLTEIDPLLSKGFMPDLVQAPFNYFDRRFEKLLTILRQNGCEVHTRSVFLQGLFFIKTNQLGSFFDLIKPTIKELQGEIDDLPASLIRFVVSQSFIDKVIIGVENALQFEENIKNLERAFPLPDLKLNIPDNILTPSKWPKT